MPHSFFFVLPPMGSTSSTANPEGGSIDFILALVRPEGFEPPAYRFVVCRSIQLSYGRVSVSVGMAPFNKIRYWSC